MDTTKTTLKAPGIKRWKLKYDKQLSSFAVNFNLRCYTAASADVDEVVSAIHDITPTFSATSSRSAATSESVGAPRRMLLGKRDGNFDGESGGRNEGRGKVGRYTSG